MCSVLAQHTVTPLTEEQQSILNNARSLISKALEYDEKGDRENAMAMYIQAIEVCTAAVSFYNESLFFCY